MSMHSSFPLTVAQRGLWFTQKITPSALMNIAEAVEICGPVKPAIFQQALHQLIAEAEQLRVRFVEHDGKPLQIPRPAYERDFPYIDMSREADPRAAIEAWMQAELSQPVDLAHDPLWFSALLKAKDDQYFWYQRAHHIVYDGYGGGLVARRLAEIYTAYAQGGEPAPNCFCTVQAMVEAEASYRASDRFLRDREYWLGHLDQLPEAVTLSRNRHRHELSSSLERSVGHLSAETLRELAELGRLCSASLPQVWIGLIAAYYQRMTGVNDLVFRMPVTGRVGAALRRSVAVSANVVPIRLSFTPRMTASELFAQVSRAVRQALRHQQYRYEDMRRDLVLLGQDQNIAWLGVNIEPFDYRLSFDGAETISHNLSNSGAEDLMVFVYDRGTDTGVRFDLDANPALYGIAELDEHRRRLTRLIEQVLAHPDRPIEQIDILGDEEQQRLLVAWNNTAGSWPYASIPSLVAQWAQTTPDAPAVVFGDTVVSYRQLHERSVSYAGQLVASGIKPGDIVAVALPRGEQLLIVLLAIMRTGAAYLPLDLKGPFERTAMVLEDASPVALIAQPDTLSRFSGRGFVLVQPEPPKMLGDASLNYDLSAPEGVVYVLYTSGSTGRPKGVEVTHYNLSNFLEGMRLQLKPTKSDRFLALTTIIFDIAGLELYLPLTVGGCVVMAANEARHNAPALARLIQRSGVTHMQATPSFWRVLLANLDTRLDNVHVLVGGEALSAELAARLKKTAARVTQFYGPTETTVWSTAFELDEIGEATPPIGRPILNTKLYVLDQNQQLVPTGAMGELYIGGAGVAKGYLNRPDLSEERFLRDPFANDGSRMYRTGDLVRWRDEGLLEFVGRTDDQIKINGHRVELGEIESVLLEHIMVAEAAVAARRDGDGAISLTAYLVAPHGVMIDISSVRSFLAGRLPNHMIPANIMVLGAMPLTANGKLDRKALPLPERASARTYDEPLTLIEKKLAVLWQKILKVERVGLHDNFFELGGDSLSAAEMIACFPEWFKLELPLGSLFEAPTIAGLAALVERFGGENIDPLGVVLPLRQPAHRPLFCIHPMAGMSLGFSSLLRHLDSTMPVYGLQSRGLRGGSLPSSIEEIAADYLEQIRRIQPVGPYRLLGRSLGGLIGHCIAEQMQEQNLEIELLAMIDSSLFLSGARPLNEEEEVQAALGFLDIRLEEETIPETLGQLGAFLLNPSNARSIPVPHQTMMRITGGIMKENPDFVEKLIAVMLNHLKLARQYRPGKVDVNLLYFHACETTGDVNGIIDRDPSAWRPFIGRKIEVHELKCHHESVFDPLPAAQIGRLLQQRLSRLKDSRAIDIPHLRREGEEMIAAYA